MPSASKIFLPCRGLGYVSNHIPLQVRYIKSRKENLIVTCAGKAFHTYGISHFGLLSVSGLHPEDITYMTSDAFHVYTSCKNDIYAWRRGTELKHVFRGHERPVCLMLPFGAHLVSVDDSNRVIIWDIKAETVFLELTFSDKITTLLHPSTYINKIVFGSDQGTMQLWNLNTSRLIYSFKGWPSAITCLEQAPAIDVAAVGLESGKIVLHNLKFDETIMEFFQDWGPVTSISFRTDGSPIMATGSTVGHIVFWNLDERRVASQLLSAHSGSVTGMVCLPNEPLVITSSPDNTLKLWVFDMPDGGARLLRIREGHSSPPTVVRFHGANGHNILTAAGDSTLRIFNTQTEQFNKSLGRASYNRKASKKRARNVEDPLVMPPIVQFTSETTREKEWDNIAAIHSGIALVTTWSYDKVKMGELKLLPERFHKKKKDPNVDVEATCLCLTHCGNFVVVGYSTGHVDRFNMQSGIWRDAYGSPKAHDCSVRGVATDWANTLTVSGGGCSIKFWRFKNKGTPPVRELTLDHSVSFFRLHRESSMLAVATVYYDVCLIDTDMMRTIRKFEGHTAPITDVTFSPDARWLVSSSMDCTIKTWDVVSSHLVDQFATESPCISLNMSPTGEVLATAHVSYLGIFLWTNRTLYSKVTLKALSTTDKAPMVTLPECVIEHKAEEEGAADETDDDDSEFKSPEQISEELVTLSGISSARWQNLLNIDVIKQRNKPKAPPKAPKSAPFFLPTVASLNFQFDLSADQAESGGSKLLKPTSFTNLTNFGRALSETKITGNYSVVIEKLKSYGPSIIDFEIKSLSPDEGGSSEVMLQFLECIKFMLRSNRNYELAVAYLGVFLKEHGTAVPSESNLLDSLREIQQLQDVAWDRLQSELKYCMCVIDNLKMM